MGREGFDDAVGDGGAVVGLLGCGDDEVLFVEDQLGVLDGLMEMGLGSEVPKRELRYSGMDRWDRRKRLL